MSGKIQPLSCTAPCNSKDKVSKNKVTKIKENDIVMGKRRGRHSVKRLNKSSSIKETFCP